MKYLQVFLVHPPKNAFIDRYGTRRSSGIVFIGNSGRDARFRSWLEAGPAGGILSSTASRARVLRRLLAPRSRCAVNKPRSSQYGSIEFALTPSLDRDQDYVFRANTLLILR